MCANSSALMAPHGGMRPFFGTNPIAWAAPRREGPPVVADLSSSAVAWVKVNAAEQAGESGGGYIDRLEEELAALASEPGVRSPGDRRIDERSRAQLAGIDVPDELMATLTAYAEHGSPARPKVGS